MSVDRWLTSICTAKLKRGVHQTGDGPQLDVDIGMPEARTIISSCWSWQTGVKPDRACQIGQIPFIRGDRTSSQGCANIE